MTAVPSPAHAAPTPCADTTQDKLSTFARNWNPWSNGNITIDNVSLEDLGNTKNFQVHWAILYSTLSRDSKAPALTPGTAIRTKQDCLGVFQCQHLDCDAVIRPKTQSGPRERQREAGCYCERSRGNNVVLPLEYVTCPASDIVSKWAGTQ